MRYVRYVFISVALITTLTASAAPRHDPGDPPILKRLVRIIRLIAQPLGDLVSPPHP